MCAFHSDRPFAADAQKHQRTHTAVMANQKRRVTMKMMHTCRLDIQVKQRLTYKHITNYSKVTREDQPDTMITLLLRPDIFSLHFNSKTRPPHY